MKRIYFSFTLLFFTSLGFAQHGGLAVYKFLELPPSARSAALGGNLITLIDNDVSLAYHNPALINPEMHNWLNMNMVSYMAGLYFGHAAYARDLGEIGTGYASVHFIQYGDFIEADASGDILGEFSAGEYNVTFGLGRSYKDFRYGGSLKMIFSELERYKSFGLALDLGGTWYNKEREIVVSAVVKNLGVQLKSYAGNREPLPLQLQAGISKRLEHVPFRFHVILHNLQNPDMTFVNPNADYPIDLETGEPIIKTPPFSEKFFRHVIIGGELLLSENFHIRVGYNHQRRKEMTLQNYLGAVGFSYGAGIGINRFNIGYGRVPMHMAGAANYFSISTNLDEWAKKKPVEEQGRY